MDYEKSKSLVIKAQNKDKKAMSELMELCYNDLYYFALKTVKDKHLAADIAQDSALEIFTTLNNLKEPAAFPLWAQRITYHQCTKRFKERKDIQPDENEDGETVLDRIPDDDPSSLPEKVAEDKELRKTVMDMIDSLPPEQSSAMMLYYYEKRSVQEIAEIQKTTVNTVKSRLNYGRKAVKTKVEDYEKRTGTSLYGVSALPLLLLLFYGKDKKSVSCPNVSVDSLISGSRAANETVSATVGAAKASAKSLPLIGKIGIIAATVLLVVGGIVGGVSLSKKNSAKNPGGDAPQSTVSENETEALPAVTVTEDPQYNNSSYLRHLFSMSDIDNGDVIFPVLNGYIKGSQYYIVFYGSESKQKLEYLPSDGLTERFRFMGKDLAKDANGKLHMLNVINDGYGMSFLGYGDPIEPELLLGDDRVVLFFNNSNCCYVNKSDMQIYVQDIGGEDGTPGEPLKIIGSSDICSLTLKSSNYDYILSENEVSFLVSVEYADKENNDIVIFRTQDGIAYYYSGNAYTDKAAYNRTYEENGVYYTSHMARIGVKKSGSWIYREKWTSLSQSDFESFIGNEDYEICLRLETREEKSDGRINKDPDGRGTILHSIGEYCNNIVLRDGNYPGSYMDDTVGFYSEDESVLYVYSESDREYNLIELPDGKKISDIDRKRSFAYTTSLLITFKDGKSYTTTRGELVYNEEISGFITHVLRTYTSGAGGFTVLMDDGHYYLIKY